MDLELAYALARKDFKTFFAITSPAVNYKYGSHTLEFIRQCQLCTEAIERGESRYVIINVPPRHGKSDVVSRRYPVWHLGDHPDHEVILACYASDLATELSGNAKECFGNCVKAKIFWDLNISTDTHKKNSWGIADHKGLMNAVGLGSSVTGKGGHLLIIDDYCKNRKEAESLAIRDSVWACFQSDLLTRLSPEGHAVVIAATRWHQDDLVGRIKEAMAADPRFPQFEIISLPAWNDVEKKWLFPERFDENQYLAKKAAVGSYAWQSLYQQDPRPREGNMLRVDKVQVISVDELPKGLKFCRAWDLASSKKERIKDDPDYTVGTEAAFDRRTNSVYVKDVVRRRLTAIERDNLIFKIGVADRFAGTTTTKIEVVAGYKDAYIRIKKALAGIQKVVKSTPKGDKVTRVGDTIEAPFEAGKVFVVKGEWNEVWLEEFAAFPAVKHDDQVDSVVIAVYDEITKGNNLLQVLSVGGL